MNYLRMTGKESLKDCNAGQLISGLANVLANKFGIDLSEDNVIEVPEDWLRTWKEKVEKVLSGEADGKSVVDENLGDCWGDGIFMPADWFRVAEKAPGSRAAETPSVGTEKARSSLLREDSYSETHSEKPMEKEEEPRTIEDLLDDLRIKKTKGSLRDGFLDPDLPVAQVIAKGGRRLLRQGNKTYDFRGQHIEDI